MISAFLLCLLGLAWLPLYGSTVDFTTTERNAIGGEALEFIVSFHQYAHHDSLVKAVGQIIGHENWQHIDRHNPGTRVPTDFVLVRFNDSSAAVALDKLAQHSSVKYVTPQRQLRALMSVASDDPESEDSDPSGTSASPSPSPSGSKGDVDPAASEAAETFHPGGNVRPLRVLRQEDDDGEGGRGGGGGALFGPRGSRARGASHQSGASQASNSITDELKAKVLWDKGFSGRGIKIAIFDTGLSKTHPHFRNIKDRTNWTDEKTLEDGLGHGTFVAGVIASHRECLGFAPDADIHVFRVFTNKQLSYTSWFLDAFNYAIHSQVDVLNLSIGGPDFLDRPFVEKVLEMSANNIIVVSAIGNDGPLYGTLNNPADQMDVIGVGGIKNDDRIAPFSSRGMTTWELPEGYGRVKPDIVAYGKQIKGSRLQGGCRQLSGTSVASPVVAGAVTLLASVAPENTRHSLINPASMKQALVESALRVPEANIFEQGMGKLNLVGAYEVLSSYVPRASVVPAKLDLTDCPYMWPYCTQDLYFSAMPIMFNLTVLNAMSVAGRFLSEPEYIPHDPQGVLEVWFSHAELIWPWSSYLAVHMRVKSDVNSLRKESGIIRVTIVSHPDKVSTVEVPLTVSISPTPPRNKRVLWDQFHNLRYPSGYFPRDNLDVKTDILDWNGDHPHTNFRELYDLLRQRGYHVEILGRDLTCFDASLYGTLLIVDPEEEYFEEEVLKLKEDVMERGLSVMVLADWYNVDTMIKVKFFDENTRSWWTPQTGGSNIPALNQLLHPFGIAFGDRVYKGQINLGRESWEYSSGTSIARFPEEGYMLSLPMEDVTADGRQSHQRIPTPILGAFSPHYPNVSHVDTQGRGSEGRLVVYGDSNCVDMNHRASNLCSSLMLRMLEFAAHGLRDGEFFSDALRLQQPFRSDQVHLPTRLEGNTLARFSRVLAPGAVPQCMDKVKLRTRSRLTRTIFSTVKLPDGTPPSDWATPYPPSVLSQTRTMLADSEGEGVASVASADSADAQSSRHHSSAGASRDWASQSSTASADPLATAGASASVASGLPSPVNSETDQENQGSGNDSGGSGSSLSVIVSTGDAAASSAGNDAATDDLRQASTGQSAHEMEWPSSSSEAALWRDKDTSETGTEFEYYVVLPQPERESPLLPAPGGGYHLMPPNVDESSPQRLMQWVALGLIFCVFLAYVAERIVQSRRPKNFIDLSATWNASEPASPSSDTVPLFRARNNHSHHGLAHNHAHTRGFV